MLCELKSISGNFRTNVREFKVDSKKNSELSSPGVGVLTLFLKLRNNLCILNSYIGFEAIGRFSERCRNREINKITSAVKSCRQFEVNPCVKFHEKHSSLLQFFF